MRGRGAYEATPTGRWVVTRKVPVCPPGWPWAVITPTGRITAFFPTQLEALNAARQWSK